VESTDRKYSLRTVSLCGTFTAFWSAFKLWCRWFGRRYCVCQRDLRSFSAAIIKGKAFTLRRIPLIYAKPDDREATQMRTGVTNGHLGRTYV
jgi:hypothetical protein